MPKRIDIEGSDPQSELEDALRQLTQRQPRAAQPADDLERAVQEVGEQQKEAVAIRRRRDAPPNPWVTKAAWIGLVAVIVGLVVTVFVITRPEPPPPEATSAEQAVTYFWDNLIQGKYTEATYYYPQQQTRFGSATQAGAQFREQFTNNPPTSIRSVGPAEVIEDGQYRVPYEVYMRSGQPRVGEFIVSQSIVKMKEETKTVFTITGGAI